MPNYTVRQPIFNRDLKVIAYQLQFSKEEKISFPEGERGLKEFTSNNKAFIDYSDKYFNGEIIKFFSNKLVAVIVSAKDDNLFMEINQLQNDGYTISYEINSYDDLDNPIMNYIDIVVIDFADENDDSLSLSEIKEISNELIAEDYKIMGKNIDDKEIYEFAMKNNFTYFMGNFYKIPVVKLQKEIPSNKMSYLRILQEVNSEEASFKEIEKFVKQDVALTYKLLRFVNSAFFGFVKEIKSINHGLVILGLREIKKWISLIVLNDLSREKVEELITISLIRAKMCEELAPKLNSKKDSFELFLLGLFSCLDALIDSSMFAILSKTSLPNDIKNALLEKDNQYRRILDAVIAYEAGNWQIFEKISQDQKFDVSEFSISYANSIKWVNKIKLEME